MTAGREQDARETLRALSEAAPAGEWRMAETHGRDYTDEGWSIVEVAAGNRAVAVTHWYGYEPHDDPQAVAAFIAAAVNYVRAALLPSPPAATGAGDQGLRAMLLGICDLYPEGTEHTPRFSTSDVREWCAAPAVPGESCDVCGWISGHNPKSVACHVAAASPPATDGDAAGGGGS